MTNPNDRWHYEWENEAPPKHELIPVGIYDGVDLPSAVVLDDSYAVYLETPNPEYNCEVTIN